MTPQPLAAPSTVTLYDARPFFEKALQYGVRHGILDTQKLDAICIEAPKGMVQIARYFGSEFLRPELEKARDRMVNLVSLCLEDSSGGDLRRAAESLRDHSFLSRSKAGSDMLKILIAMPQSSHFGMNEGRGFHDDQIPQLAKWSLRSLADYQSEFAQRQQVALILEAAIWLAGRLGMDADALEDAGKDAEAVIRTALLVQLAGRTEMPDWVAFEKLIAALRKQAAPLPDLGKGKPADLPASLNAVVEAVHQSLISDWPKIMDPKLPARKLFDQSPAFMGRYFWLEDGLVEVDHHDRTTSAAWRKVTGGNTDESSLLTLFLTVACNAAPKTLLTEKSAATLLRRIQKTGLQPALAQQYIRDRAPAQHQGDYLALWDSFIEDAGPTLQSDAVNAFSDALALLRRECHVKQG